ncbi:MAG TPA: lipoate-protein ligase B, partial [Nocardioidaceae bacterium]|nr:lipoate-protein ligase B [Nocardioidaceae bacterium]
MREIRFETAGFGDEAVEYVAAWDLQRGVHEQVAAGGVDRVLFLEHPPVFTAGKRTEPFERPL